MLAWHQLAGLYAVCDRHYWVVGPALVTAAVMFVSISVLDYDTAAPPSYAAAPTTTGDAAWRRRRRGEVPSLRLGRAVGIVNGLVMGLNYMMHIVHRPTDQEQVQS